MATIDELLRKHNTYCEGRPSDICGAKRRLELSKLLAENFPEYDKLRLHLQHDRDLPVCNEPLRNILDAVTAQGWIKPADQARKGFDFTNTADAAVRNYLFGQWLEEYVATAFDAAGADEVYWGQKICWTLDGVVGNNEIDVIARKGENLVLGSCKAVQPFSRPGLQTEVINYLREVHDWDLHFSNGQARAVMALTLDLYEGDEVFAEKHRYPVLTAKSKILDLSIIGLEQLKWARLVPECRRLLT